MSTRLAEWTPEDSDALDVEILVECRRRAPMRRSKMGYAERGVMITAARTLAAKGRDDEAIAEHLGITSRSILRWKKSLAASGEAWA
ncbi:hypothetical protein [Rhodococcus pyridinivorans]|uniref:Uncharacterized protein n=1 Tax=Rhodococcus pyridinivorans AK37 TaxID=1114960 RepID=H0JL76_9NOCA|nr:hypothetical protein [Rhodococcus pyridinivorans]EHK86411.1 hypothetical protein AK37_01647 [Rhodococcus pyridinivorans AK37]MCD2139498.1 hypothetical protein [Rhodococcus pyridinivorans]